MRLRAPLLPWAFLVGVRVALMTWRIEGSLVLDRLVDNRPSSSMLRLSCAEPIVRAGGLLGLVPSRSCSSADGNRGSRLGFIAGLGIAEGVEVGLRTGRGTSGIVRPWPQLRRLFFDFFSAARCFAASTIAAKTGTTFSRKLGTLASSGLQPVVCWKAHLGLRQWPTTM
jgi:hypothetical protein